MAAIAMGIALMLGGPAHAEEPEIDFGGRIQSDLRFTVLQMRAEDTVGLFGPEPPAIRPNKPVGKGSWFNPTNPPPKIIRNQNMVNFNLLARSGDFRGKVDLDLVMTGYPGNLNQPGQIDTLQDLSNRAILEPVRFETHSMYLEARDVGIDGLDLRIGQQLVQFGVGDQFNPTNVFNPNDVEDVLMFGEQMGNIMARADYALGNWTATAVLIPVFKPSLIPASGPLALTKIPRLPFYEDELRWRVHSEAYLGTLSGYRTVVGDVNLQLPESTAANMPFGFNIGGFIGAQDVALMYYNGFADIPGATGSHTTQEVFDNPLCRGEGGQQCINGLLRNNVTLTYPAIQVVGYNMAGEINPLFFMKKPPPPLGYRVEAALVFPEEQRTRLTSDEIVFGAITQPAGEYDYAQDTPGGPNCADVDIDGDGEPDFCDGPNGDRPLVLDSRPFPKWVIGLDYTFGKHLMVNGQWVHGMLDELGSATDYVVRDGGVKKVKDENGNWVPQNCGLPRLVDPLADPGPGETCAEEVRRSRLSDLAVIGFDVNFANRAGLVRIFTITDLTGIRYESYSEEQEKRVGRNYGPFTEQGRSGILLSELGWNFGNGFDLGGGLLYQYGQPYTKFGDPANGGSFVFTRARYAF